MIGLKDYVETIDSNQSIRVVHKIEGGEEVLYEGMASTLKKLLNSGVSFGACGVISDETILKIKTTYMG